MGKNNADTAGSDQHGDRGDAATETTEETSVGAVLGAYTWEDFKREVYYDEDGARPTDLIGDVIEFDASDYLGFDPADIEERLTKAASKAAILDDHFDSFLDVETTDVAVGEYYWEHFKIEYYYDEEGKPPVDKKTGEVVEFDASEYLGFDPTSLPNVLSYGNVVGDCIHDVREARTVNVLEDLDEDAFFRNPDGTKTVVNRYDLEKAVPLSKKSHFHEVDRYWVNKPFAFVSIFHSSKENEHKYYLVEPYLTPIERELKEYLTNKLRTAIKYSDEDIIVEGDEADRGAVIARETEQLLERYDLYARPSDEKQSLKQQFLELLGRAEELEDEEEIVRDLAGMLTRPEPALLEEDARMVTEYQVEKLLYMLKRDFIGYERIDGVKHDINVEDVSCDGYNSPVFVYHSDYEQIISNIFHGEKDLDDFVVKLAQRSGKGISKRQPQVGATLPDGSRAQLTLGREVSDHGTNYTIRQFKEVPFTPIDLINWHTFSLDEMAYLWVCIENNKSLIFAGGTASGKTTSLNAVSLFIPSKSKIVSIEDTREVELPQRNWIASTTRPSFTADDQGDVDEFDLLAAALRQRPEYIVMGEIRGEEGRTLFQVMSTGHTTLTTFHADSVGEVIKRFTTDPINVSKTMFTALDLVSIQTSTRVHGDKVRRSKSITEINHYDPENDEINVQDVFQWQAESDEFLRMGESNTLDEIRFDRGWSYDQLDEAIYLRKIVLAYLINKGLNSYPQVAAALQGFMNDNDTIMSLIANGELEARLEELRQMESVMIDIDPEKEAMIPRPDPYAELRAQTDEILAEAEENLFDRYLTAGEPDLEPALASGADEAGAATDGGDDTDDDDPFEAFDFGGFEPLEDDE
ncbi:type II/IV secretion system ATPase subunit [Haladaptatus sp. ZSTT2]|uniref:type II/IV secretion system ATPase subunit n=1 Tax=Haladaptatus sp. ZSTT2 TaxID=3120515 RepID=UPI00300EDF06